MTQVELAHVPRLIRWRHRHCHSVFQRELIRFINCGRRFQPPTHPHASGFIITDEFWHWASARTLRALAQKDFRFSVAHCAKGRRVAPIPSLLPAKLFKPFEGLGDICDVEYWS